MAWLIKVPPTVTHVFPTRDTRLRICQGLDDRSYMVGLIYPFILIGKLFVDILKNLLKKIHL